ncbi:MAG: hypothetical protein H0V01_03715 [Bacteroidetes bacterium]|nr:hypothetical protein [Bacteroidota bacterium]HET6245504.1 hypothetical protein [Bacteroidia bacterium]
MITIYLDENLSHFVAHALNSLNKGYFKDIQVLSTIEKFGRGVKDEDLIPEIGKEGGVLITRDIRIQRTHLQWELCHEYKLGMFFLTLPKGHTRHWDLVKALVNQWEEIAEIAKNKRIPFGYRVHLKKVEILK